MLVNLTEILTSEEKIEEKTVPYEAEVFESRIGTFSIAEKSPVQLQLQNVGKGKAIINGTMDIALNLACDRCLKEVAIPFHLKFSEGISIEDIEHPAEADEKNYMEGYHLDADLLIGNEILTNWPMKVLCSEECKGICTSCGKDLNLGACGCDTFVPDPRMAMIKDIFNANKEV